LGNTLLNVDKKVDKVLVSYGGCLRRCHVGTYIIPEGIFDGGEGFWESNKLNQSLIKKQNTTEDYPSFITDKNINEFQRTTLPHS
jgi:hypothetical protein